MRSERIRVSYRYIFLNNVSVPLTQYWFFIPCNPLSHRFWFITGKILSAFVDDCCKITVEWQVYRSQNNSQLRKCFDWCKINITNLFSYSVEIQLYSVYKIKKKSEWKGDFREENMNGYQKPKFRYPWYELFTST